MSKKFIIVGAAGFVAPRHMKAIKEHDGEIIAIVDPSDSVGIIDRYEPGAGYYRDLDDCLDHRGDEADFVSICTPNDLHFTHAIRAMEAGCDVICEKPVVTNVSMFDHLLGMTVRTGRSVYPVLQLREHPLFAQLKKLCRKQSHININYWTPRGSWYRRSWKSDYTRSGGPTLNIGIHLFDLLVAACGPAECVREVTHKTNESVAGTVQLQNGSTASFNLSIEKDCEPGRWFQVGDDSLDFSTGFSELHTDVYGRILAGEGLNLLDAFPSLKLCWDIDATETTVLGFGIRPEHMPHLGLSTSSYVVGVHGR